jgi:MoaA/NifB/PqqE/SkfB family radical SAM enzyme
LNGRGESTIHPQFKKIVQHIGHSIQMSLFTNGNYYDAEINDLMIKYDIELYFSMDSPKRELLEEIRRGVSFERINKNIQKMRLKKSRPFIIFTLQELNIDEIIAIADYSISNNCNLIYNVLRRDQGIEVFQDMILDNIDRITDQFNKVEKMFEKLEINVYIPNQISGISIKPATSNLTCGSMDVCPNINKELCILFNGDVTPCNMFNPYIYGNLNDNTLEEILNGEQKKWFELNHKEYYYCKNCACLVR